MEEAIVLYPSPGMGHLISMVELGKLILKHHPSFTITILIFSPSYSTGSTTQYINSVSSTINPSSLNFYHLPTIFPPQNYHSLEELAMELPILNNPNVHIALQTISKPIKAFVIDFFNNASFEVAAKLGIPTYYFYTSGASSLAVFLYFPTIDRNTTKSFEDFDDDELIDIPGAPSLHVFNFPKHMMDRTNKSYKAITDTAVQMAKSKGIITNTFEALEPRAFKALTEGLCVPDGQTPPVYCLGPLISTKEQSVCDNGVNQHECLSWLESQPSKSVVFLCFGSMGLFSGEQLTEMAIRLEKSGHRFLWVVRNPPTDDHNKSNLSILTPPDPNLDEILPKGFMERTKDRGLVVKSWAPQVDVLNHDSVGGFVTHCGWNSVLEALSAGVPMIAWPLYAEQRSNMVFMVEEMKIALSVNESGDGSVSATELEERVRELLESEKGKEVRDKVLEMKDAASAANREGGSSIVALIKLTQSWRQH